MIKKKSLWRWQAPVILELGDLEEELQGILTSPLASTSL